MPRKPRKKSSTGMYHVMLRGINYQWIFHDEQDRRKFLEILVKGKLDKGFKLYAWCLMDNHVHLVLEEGELTVSRLIQRIACSYAMYYNWKYQASGPVFYDRFRSETVESIRYLFTVIRYVHQNPVKANLVKRPSEWDWSSCKSYYGQYDYFSSLVNKQEIFHHFSDNPDLSFQKFKEYNEQTTPDECLKQPVLTKNPLTDEQALHEMKHYIGKLPHTQVKNLPVEQRNQLIAQLKQIKGISQRQLSRILGVSVGLIRKAR
ncbi:transposase [Jeotgalibacillus aurantiacus]|uniref:transposase n=1 Tax=Jeotgalibacillus aurantiacus TaxID=2763266 RepID=UPI001D0B936D|nr:transposase [Jeotgalibacillus aurantiacus]